MVASISRSAGIDTNVSETMRSPEAIVISTGLSPKAPSAHPASVAPRGAAPIASAKVAPFTLLSNLSDVRS